MLPRRFASSLLAAGLLALVACRAMAGGGPAGYIVVYNPNDLNSVTIAMKEAADIIYLSCRGRR